MSFSHYNEVWSLKLPVSEKAVLLAIAKHADKNGIAWPSVTTIAELVGCTDRQVYRILPKLKEKGLIASTRKNHHVVYQLTYSQVPTDISSLPTDILSGPPDTMSPEYVIEHNSGTDNGTASQLSSPEIQKAKMIEPCKTKVGMKSTTKLIDLITEIWREEIYNMTNSTVTPLTKIEQSALKAWCERIGDEALEVFRSIMTKWEGFRGYLLDEGGLDKVPKIPGPLLIAKYPQLALCFKKQWDSNQYNPIPMNTAEKLQSKLTFTDPPCMKKGKEVCKMEISFPTGVKYMHKALLNVN